MRLLTHHQLDNHRVKTQFAKLAQAVARDDFKSPNLKKLSPTPYWRLKLDQTHRLLVRFARHGDETVCLALEVVLNHHHAGSRLLRGASLQWDQIDIDDNTANNTTTSTTPTPTPDTDAISLGYLHPQRSDFTCWPRCSASTAPSKPCSMPPRLWCWWARLVRANPRSRWRSCARHADGCCMSRSRPFWRKARRRCTLPMALRPTGRSPSF